MSNFERSMRRQAQRREFKMRELSEAEAEAAAEAAVALTDRLIQIVWDEEGDDEIEEIANSGLKELGERYGGAGLLVTLLTVVSTVIEHMLHHGESVSELDEMLDRSSSLHRADRRAAARRLAEGMVAAAAGLAGREGAVLGELFDALGKDVGVVVTGVWQAVVMVGGVVGIGAEWCSGGEGDEPGDVVEALEVAGVVAGVIGLIESGTQELARLVVASLVGQVLPVDGVLACLAVLEAPGSHELDVAALGQLCKKGAEDAQAWEDDEETDEEMVEQMLRRFADLAKRYEAIEAFRVLGRLRGEADGR